MKKKLLIVASTQAHICHFHLPYLRQFKENGWTVHAACGNADGNIAYTDCVLPLPLKKRIFSYGNLQSARMLRKQIRQEKYDAVIVHTSLAAFFTRIAVLGLNGRPTVINMVHGYLFDEHSPFLKRGILLAAEKLTASVTDLVITMNRCDHEIAVRHKLGKRITSVPGVGVDFSALERQRTGRAAELRRTLGIGEDDFVLIYPAEFSRRKAHPVLLRAMTVLPEKTVLVLPGMGKKHTACRRLAEELGISHCVRFPGYVDNIAPWYEMANAAVFSSRSEGLPFSVMEAMYFGLPVVASDVKGHADLVKDGTTGLSYPFGDWRACAAQVEKLIKEPALADAVSQTAKEKVMQYSLPAVQPKIMELYCDREYRLEQI